MGVNVLHDIIQKSWALQSAHFEGILNEVDSFNSWLERVVPAAKESIARNVPCNLPCGAKRQKIDVSDTNQYEDVYKEKSNRKKQSIKGKRRSTRCSTKKQLYAKPRTPSSNRSLKVTRSTTRNTFLNENVIGTESCFQEFGSDGDLQSNTTKSFIEHEADICMDVEKQPEATMLNTESPVAMKDSGCSIAHEQEKPKSLFPDVSTLLPPSKSEDNNSINQVLCATHDNIAVGITSFLKPKNEAKTETVQDKIRRKEELARQRDEARQRLVHQAALKKQQEIEEKRRLRQEREQRVAERQTQNAQADEVKIRMAREKFELLRKKEEKLKRDKEKGGQMKREQRERKMAEAEAKRRKEEAERKAKLAEKEEEEKWRSELLQRKQEYEELERKKKIEEQKRQEEQRIEEHQRALQLQEERIRREMEERAALVRQRLEEKAQREKEERQQREQQEKKRLEKRRSQEREEQERLRKEADEAERIRKEGESHSKEAEEQERKLNEKKEQEIKEHNATKLEQKQIEVKRTFEKAEMALEVPVMKSPTRPAPHINKGAQGEHTQKVQCTSYITPTLNKVKSKLHKKKSPSVATYNIDDLTEDDSTDDEEDPAQKVPSWAKGKDFADALLQQEHSNIDPYEIFQGLLEPPKLEKIFPKLRARFFKRTSSACWDHAPRPKNMWQ